MPMRGFRLAAIGCALAVLAACGGGSSNPGGGTTNPSATAYVALPSSDQVAVYRVDSSNHFTNIIGSPFTAGTAPVTVLVHPNNKFIYALNQGSSNISLFTTDNRTGVLTEVLPRTFTELSPVSMLMNKTGSLIFVLNQAAHSISVYSVNSSSGALTEIAGSPVTTAIHPSAMALSRAENFLYIANINLNSVSAFSVAADGSLTAVAGSPFPIAVTGSGPTALATGASDHFLYVVNQVTSNISIMTINSTTGALAEILGSPFAVTGSGTTPATGTGPNYVVLDSTGSFLYVTCTTSNNLFGFSVDANTGKLNALTNSPYTTGTNPSLSLVNSTGNALFVINPGSKNISFFTINSDGTLTSITDNSLSTPTAASSLAFTH